MTTSPALTRTDIIQLAGELEDAAITAILESGATYAELEEALMWANGDASEMRRQNHELSAVAAIVYDILLSDPAFIDTER
jgi:hypothetical protein